MPWIRTVEPGDAVGDLADLYRRISSARGGIAEVHLVQSLNPAALRAHLDLYTAVVFGRSSLSRIARERIAVVVSAANDCRYCVAHHREALRRLGDDPSIVEALARGQISADLDEADRALLWWAKKSALLPSSASATDIRALASHGLDDRAILDAALTVAYFSFVNRLVLLLGVELEADYAKTCGSEGPGAGPIG